MDLDAAESARPGSIIDGNWGEVIVTDWQQKYKQRLVMIVRKSLNVDA